MAKNLIVKSEGIGEDLAFNFFAWREDKPFLCAQLEGRNMKENHLKRFGRCYELMRILRFGLGVQSLTFIAEGYVAETKQEKELSLAFLEPNSSVKECLTVIHCDECKPSSSPDTYLFSMPYRYGLGKEVKWGPLMEFSQNATETIKRYSYPAMLNAAFSIPIDSDLSQNELDSGMIGEIIGHGFLVQEF